MFKKFLVLSTLFATSLFAHNLHELGDVATGMKPEAALEQILQDNKLVIIKFYDPHCPACQHMKPFFEKVANNYAASRPDLYLLSIPDKYEILFSKYNIRGIPTFVFIKDGKIIIKKNILSESELNKTVQKFLGN